MRTIGVPKPLTGFRGYDKRARCAQIKAWVRGDTAVKLVCPKQLTKSLGKRMILISRKAREGNTEGNTTMAGNHTDTATHRIVSGETPALGLEVITNNLDRGTITKVATDAGCGFYCNAWHTVTLHTNYKGEPITGTTIMNCDRLTTRMPR